MSDPIQLIRALRFVSLYGMEIEQDTLQRMKAALSVPLDSSAESMLPKRVRYELNRLFLEAGEPSPALELALEAGMLARDFSELQELHDHAGRPGHNFCGSSTAAGSWVAGACLISAPIAAIRMQKRLWHCVSGRWVRGCCAIGESKIGHSRSLRPLRKGRARGRCLPSRRCATV